jgi:undecaprenyl-diphosphatase
MTWMEWIQKIDFAVLDWIQQHIKGDFLDFLMPLITALGNGGIFFGLLAVFLLCRKKYRRAGIVLLGGLTFCLIFGNLLLKPLVARIRPYDLMEGIELLIKPLKDYSFPSGHTMASFACASVFWHYRDTFKKWSIVALVLAFCVAFSRLYLYVHFPTDVLCGGLLGWLFGWVACRIADRVRLKKTV